VCNHNNKCKKQLQYIFENKNLSKNKTHFIRKSSKCQNTLQLSQNIDLPKDPLNFPKKKLQVHQKTVGILEKMKILINLLKLLVIQPHPTSKTWNWTQK
jgi:uncharacterized protein YpiB (UPF0302 family)